MSLSQNGYSFENCLSQILTSANSEEVTVIRGTAFGVKGEAHNIDRPKGDSIQCEITLSGYSSILLLHQAIDRIRARRGLLTGTLTQVAVDGTTRTYPHATFKQAVETRAPWRGGQNGTWVCFMQLTWQLTGT